MATTPTIFNKNLVDLTGLNSFWEAAKAYIDGQIDGTEELVNNLSSGQVTTNKNDIATINEKLAVAGVNTGTNGALGTGTIKTYVDTQVNALNDGQVTTNKNDIATLKGKVDNLSDNLDANINGKIDTKLNPVIEDVEQNTQDISGITTKLSKAGIGTNGTIGNGTIQAAITNAVNGLANGQVATNTSEIGNLKETVNGHTTTLTTHGETIANLPAVMDSKIKTLKESLDYTGGAFGDGKYASKVVMTDGALTVTYTALPDIDGKDAAILSAAKKYTDDELVEHAALSTHITAAERSDWNNAATSINTFLTSTTTNDVIDNLTEINNWFAGHEGQYGELLANVNTNTNNIASNLDKIDTINTNLATITIASTTDCAAIVSGN